MSEVELVDKFEKMNTVVEELLKGNNPNQIARSLSMKRAEVLEMLELWRGLMHSDKGIRERAREALSGADQHYAMLINRAWETVEQSDINADLRTKTTALKLIADIEGKRIDMLQRAGLLENNEMTAQLLETERKQEVLMGILKDVTSTCDHCKFEVAKRLSSVTGRSEEVPLDE